MGVLWSSPYRLQIISISVGMVILTTGFMFLLVSVGLEDPYWRLLGLACASVGSLLTLGSGCWCACSVRRDRFSQGLTLRVPDAEGESLTNDIT